MNCAQCGTQLTDANTTHGVGLSRQVRWCDTCWAKYWDSRQEPAPSHNQTDPGGLNRERVRNGYGNTFYAMQSACLAQWTRGAAPVGLIMGELPYVGHFRADKRDE